jgi:hypothetical protein
MRADSGDDRAVARVEKTGLALLDEGYWVIPIRAKGEPIRRKNPRFAKDPEAPEFLEKPAEGKEPVGQNWGGERWTKDRLRAELARRPDRGIGICLGPGRGPGGSWLVDVEGDGERAVAALEKLVGGEPPDTVSWASTRGSHRLFGVHGPRLEGALAAAGAREDKGSPGVWHLEQFPDLEFRVGGFKADGTTIKQLQSVVPPTPSTDGKPRVWIGSPRVGVAELPDAAYSNLAGLGYGPAALGAETAALAIKGPGERHDGLLASTMRLAGLVKAGTITEGQALAALRDAARVNGLEAEGRADEVDELWASAMQKATPRSIPGPGNARRTGGGPHHQGNGRPAPSAPSPGAAPGATFSLLTTRASQVRPEPVEFLDGGVLPRGKLITVAGLGGAGKGMFWANFVADASRGRPSLGLQYEAPPAIEVLLIGCEDGYADTVNPRLLAADADLDKVHILNGVKADKGRVLPFSLAYLDALEAYLRDHPEIALVIIDPITGYIGRAGARDHHDAEVRSLLEPLAEMAARRGTTVLIIKHLNKDEAKTVAGRVGGSIAFVNVPRGCFVVAADPEDEARRVLAVFKWNLNAPRPRSIAWTMEPPPADLLARILDGCDHLDEKARGRLAEQLHRLAWAGPVDMDADGLLRAAARVERRTVRDEVERATEWLRERLADGPVGSVVVAREGDAAMGRRWPPADTPAAERRRLVLGRVKWWRENVLKAKLGGESRQSGFRGPWFFRLPDHAWPPSADVGIAARRADDAELNDDPGPSEPFDVNIRRGSVRPATEATGATEATDLPTSAAASVEQGGARDGEPPSHTPTEGPCCTANSVDSVASVASVGGRDGAGNAAPSLAAEAPEYGEIDWRAPMDDEAF